MSAPSKAKFISSISDGKNENDSNAAATGAETTESDVHPTAPHTTLACGGQEHQPPPVKDAFSILLSSSKDLQPKKRRHPHSSPTTAKAADLTRRTHGPNWRDCLLPYLNDPSNYPQSTILQHNPSFVTIFDAYPKSSIHLLILPRDPLINTLHPIDALNNYPNLLANVRQEATGLIPIVQKELLRRFGELSTTQRAHDEAVAKFDVEDADNGAKVEIPPPRTYELKVGIHAHPSLTHLHIHLLTPDMVNTSLKHKKHYNSFTTGFFIPLEDFPLAEGDYRCKHPGRDETTGEVYLKGDMRCWRCGRNFGSRFTMLKEHLLKERADWLAE